MADNKKSVNLLPEYLRSDKNSKFLSSTIDQLIQTPQLERINGFIGSKITPNYNSANDVYIKENFSLRKDYQLEPALVFKNSAGSVTDVVGYADLINELSIQGAKTDNHDRLLRSEFYSYDPLINWDALINYSQYYWLPNGPDVILIDNSETNVIADIIDQPGYEMENGFSLSNGMKLVFTNAYTDGNIAIEASREYIVEGVGSAITLIRLDLLDVSEALSVSYNESFDSELFDSFPFDGDKKLPITPEYITINRASVDLNPWSRYNRWFHSDVIKVTAEINGTTPVYPVSAKSRRPIIEFKPNIQLYNFGQTGKQNIDLIDTDTRDPFTQVHGTPGYYIDQVLLEEGQRVVFNAAEDESVKGNIYRVSFTLGSSPVVQLVLDTEPSDQDSVSVNFGIQYSGSSFYFDALLKVWIFSQQHTKLNEPPLFALYDNNGISFAADPNINDFEGSKIFGYDVGTGTPDSILGFALKYQNSVGVGSYLFKNYFMTDTITATVNNQSSKTTTGFGYLKINNADGSVNFTNVWKTAATYKIPVIEQQTILSDNTGTMTITSLDVPASTNTSIVSFINGVRVNPTVTLGDKIVVNFSEVLNINDFVQFNITTDQSPNANGYYEPTLSLTNNPLNGPMAEMTLSELSDHLGTMIPQIPNFTGSFPGVSNLRDLTDYTKYGTRLISNATPIAYAHLFLGKKEHNLVDAMRLASDQYNQFKMNLIRSIVNVDSQLSPADALDYVLKFINKDKDNTSSYYRSDMLAYGSDKIVKEYTVGVVPNYVYAIGMDYNPTVLSFKSVLVYLNDIQLTNGTEYTIDSVDGTITILSTLRRNDVIKVCTYDDTLGAFIPSTPTKLGLYPSFVPEIFNDTSYVGGTVTMIKGHDGSIVRAYGDYRDAILLEYEKRVFNNIKVSYNSELFDIVSIIPGAFRNSAYSYSEVNDILRKDFVKWAGVYGIDIADHSIFDDSNGFTYNYKGSLDTVFGQQISGSWRNIYNYFYDTDRPNTHPWEMLGYAIKPSWWETYYGVGPYTSANTVMWADLRDGLSRGTMTYNADYARPQLLSILPVDGLGNLISPDVFLTTLSTYENKQAAWIPGDQGPAESAWMNSSYWPFAVNVLAALLQPSKYSASMYDVSRTSLNQNNQIVYAGDIYLNLQNIIIEGDQGAQTAGYGVYVIEKGTQKDQDYLTKFKQDVDYLNFNLFYKVGGFTSKDKLQFIIDSVDPSTQSQSAILPPEDYSLILNVSNPVKSVRISGVIVQRSNGKFVVKGYDRTNPYFEILKPIKSSVSGAVTVGGKSAPFTEWSNVTNNGATGLSSIDTTSAESNTTRYYKQGQIVRYNSVFYRVKVGHTAQAVFDPALFQQLPGLPVTGGASVQRPSKFESTVTQVPYGTEYTTIQEVYDLLVGYGAFLESQGFVFDEYNTELFEILDWSFTGKEFLFWSTQAWADNNLITLSPFAGTLKYQFTDSIVDNISTGKYEYSLLKADGKSFPIKNFRLTRDDGVCTINTIDTEEGFFFATLNLVQKEHAMVFNNSTIFNDTIYDIETGYRQSRMNVSGFRTANWNGDFFSPGFIFDNVEVSDWKSYQIYNPGIVVRYNGAYYESSEKINGDKNFEFNKWVKLPEKPTPSLLPNFDYKISQFEDFYSLDIDNFDSSQQQLSQQLLGYNQRPYLTNIFTNPTTQYKFYQGFIRDKGTKNALDKIVKVGAFARNGDISFNEEWAFRVGYFGGFETYKEIEFTLDEGTSLENPYLVKLVNTLESNSNSLINYIPSSDMLIKPADYNPSTTFNTYNSTGYDDTNFELSTAGYVSIDDVTATAYNKNSLLDIANNSDIKEGNTIWLGFLEDGGWTVYRYARQSAKVAGVFVDAPAESITFVTDIHHNVAVGDIISVVAFNDQVNGVYIVKDIPELNQITVASELSTIVNEELLAFGALFKFDNARYAGFKELSEVKNLLNLSPGDKLWIDSASNEKWAVYEKTINYNTGIAADTYTSPFGQELGHTVFANDDSNVIMVSAPSWESSESGSVGKVWVYDTSFDLFEKKYEYILNSDNLVYAEPSTATEFGYSLTYDNNKDLYFAGAPAASDVRVSAVGTVVFSTGTGAVRNFENEGLVKISSRASFFGEEKTERVLARPNNDATPAANARFGHSLYINQVAESSSTTVLVGAPGDGDLHNSIGHVYAYLLTATSVSVDLTAHPAGFEVLPTVSSSKMQWGHKIAGDAAGNFVAISAPGYVGTGLGMIQLFDNELEVKQTIESPFDNAVVFGDDLFVSSSGKFLVVSSKNTKSVGEGYGKVAIYTATNLTSTGTYVLHQIINNPVATNDLRFGHSISMSKDETILVISSLGKNRSQYYEFDETGRSGITTFDQNTTRFIAPIADSGAAYVYNNLGDYFVPAEELNDAAIIEGSRYGYSVAATNKFVLVGAPWYAVTSESDDSTFFKFDKIDETINSFKVLQSQPELVDVNKVKRIALINSVDEEIVEYLDVYDPLKGRIPGLASQELKYKVAADPAIYTIGTAGTVVDTESSWIDEHVGELWWDLSTLKYTWYEQGNEIFRKNNWGRLFPGSTVDVYEWVKSDLLPSEWAAQADTNEGLTLGISGQPKYPDNSIISVKQLFNNVTNSFENVYYYWVKNKVTVPDITNRRISSFQVASLITDPAANGLKFAEIVSPDAMALANVQPLLVGNNINANIAVDSIDNEIPRHTEWLLLEEGSASSMPTTMLNKKLFDSLLGHDVNGTLVPDPTLSYRSKYGIGIRPQQTLFKDRLEALRNIVEFSNSVLIKNRITGSYNFENLNSKEEIPDQFSKQYDIVVEDLFELDQVDTTNFSKAKVECLTFNGRIISVTITDPGYGYSLPPEIVISSETGSGAILATTINSSGELTSVAIENAGSNYTELEPLATVRSHTVIVAVNEEFGNRWTKHEFDYTFRQWIRVKTQSYNTPLYWKYVDWVSDSYNGYKDYKYVIADSGELSRIVDTVPGDYVKINNIGDGRYVILEKIKQGNTGNFSTSYNIVYSQRGTIQILNDIWNYLEGNYAYDSSTMDETLYDQVPDLELFKILTALKDDLFVKDLKINWNLLFFKAVKYALTEQKLLDWAFKTSFITVNNKIGELDQRPVYRLDNESYFEEYIKEIKPYRTKIRSYTTDYSVNDTFGGAPITDFDLPSYFNSLTNTFEQVGLGNPLITETPWKWWAENYKYYVSSIEVADQGEGYTQQPTIEIITAPGDSGSGASATAYIKDGKLYKILVTSPGSGYVTAPTLNIIGGGTTVTRLATASVIMDNDYIRKNKVNIKFDRVGVQNEIGNNRVTESFTCSGVDNKFALGWLAEPAKSHIIPLLDGKLVLSADYTIEYFTETVDNYTKKHCRFVFLNYVPLIGQVFKITYNKNIDLYSAVDRINEYYEPTDSMVGKELPLLMSGAEQGGTQIQGLSFGYSPPWGQGFFDNDSAWSDLVAYYSSAKLVANVDYATLTLELNSTEGISVGQRVNIVNTSTKYIREGTVVTEVNTLSNTVVLSDKSYTLDKVFASSSTNAYPVVFYTIENLNYLQENDKVVISLDDGTVTGYDGDYIVTGVGTDRFEAVAVTSSALSTTTIRTVTPGSSVYVPAVLENINALSDYKLYQFIDDVISTTTDAIAAQYYGADNSLSPAFDRQTVLTINPITGDNIILNSENTGTITITGKVSGIFSPGDIVTLVVNSVSTSSTATSTGSYSVSVSAVDLSASINKKIEGSVVGTGGDTGIAEQHYIIEPTDTFTQAALIIDPVTVNNIIDISESIGSIAITGQVTGKFKLNDIVILKVNNKVFTGRVEETGRFSIDVPVTDLLANSDGKIAGIVGPVFYNTQFLSDNVSSIKIMLGLTELSESPGPVEYYEEILNNDNETSVIIYNLGKNTTNNINLSVYGYPTVEFWKDNFNASGVDTDLNGGSWNGSGNFVGALGVNPSDIVIHTGSLIDPNFGFAPEEHVKGHVLENININVYTQDDQTSPLVVTGVVPVEAFRTTVAKLGLPVDESVGIMVNYKNKVLDRLATPPDAEDIGPYFSVAEAVPKGPVGPPIASSAGDDFYTGPYTIPFTWNMFGSVFTEVYVSTNGYLTFGGPGNNFPAPWRLADVDDIPYPSILVEYCDFWQDFGISGQGLITGEIPGLYISDGTIANFNYWRLRFQGSHYSERETLPRMPAYQYEVTLYSDGVNQYVEMIYENTWRSYNVGLEPSSALGFFTGIATANLNEFVQVPYTDIQNNTSHVFYSTQSGGEWKYAGQGSFDPYKDPYNFTSSNQYYIKDDSIYIAPQLESGRAGYTLMTMGGENVIDSNSVLVDDPTITSIVIDSIANINDVRSVYVTADGIELTEVESTSSYGYMVTPLGINNNRAAITVYNIPTTPTTLQAWFLKSNHPEFNGMWEETFVVETTATTFELSRPLPNIEPVSAQIFVEVETDSSGVKGRRRLMPPDVTYYKIENGQTVFDIDTKSRPVDTFFYTPTLSNVRVYGNGALLRPGFDYILTGGTGTITLSTGLLPNGSVIAIEIMIDYDYVVVGNTVILTEGITNTTLKVTTFTDHTGMIIRTERFDGNATRRFVLSLPAVSSEYIWVYVDGAPLIAGYDYALLDDMRTVQFSEWTEITLSSDVAISVINSPFRSNIIVGYNISSDIFGRVGYNRITDFYSTRLTKELNLTDTEIHVEDNTRLIPPNPSRNLPGVVFVDSERIEFFSRANNVLGDLRRSTMGTGPASYSEIGTKLLDRTPQQRVPYSDVIKLQKHITSSTTNEFVLNTVSAGNNTYTVKISTSSYVINTGTLFESTGTGMTLAAIDGLSNQLTVKYGGRVLRKNTGTVHNPDISYDSTAESVYTIPPEFTVVYNSGTGDYEVNITVDDFRLGTRIDIEQKTGSMWHAPGDSILISNSIQAEFLRAKTTNLPDSYYYGGNPVLTDDTNFELTDEDNNPLEGY